MSLKKSSNPNLKRKLPKTRNAMARRRKKNDKPNIHRPASLPTKRFPAGLLVAITATLILGGIPFGIGKYIEFNSPGPFDSGAYVYSARHLLDGARMGIDETPSARPGTLIMNIIGVKLFGFNDTGPKIVQMILQLAALIFMFITLRKVFGPVAAVIGSTIAAVYLSAPLIAKFGNVKEQFMIAFMIYAACAFLWYEYTHKRYWLALTGFFALQPYYFKPTGMSVVFAIILYILIHNTLLRKWRALWIQLALFLCGYATGLIIPGWLFTWQGIVFDLLKSFPPMAIALGVGVLALTGIPLGLCILADKKNIGGPKKIPGWIWGAAIALIVVVGVITQWSRILSTAGLKGDRYLADSLSARGLAELAPQVFRYYKALSVPVLMALVSILTAATMWIRKRMNKTTSADMQSKVVWMLAIWWILDMAFIWVSPRSYEQYYLPLCASAAMLSGFAVWAWQRKFVLSVNKLSRLVIGVIAAIILGCLSIPIFIGQRYSPDTGADYVKTYGHKRRGFAESLDRIKQFKKQPYPWQQIGNYIRTHSDKEDTIYVWGWYPGIYVQAQRMAPVPKASEGNMHVMSPQSLAAMVNRMVAQFEQTPPKFIVDSRKVHFPNDRPQLELWPIVRPKILGNEKERPLRNDPQEISVYDARWEKILETQIEPDEAKRYEAMKPLRDFVMKNYRIVGYYENHVLLGQK